MMTRKPLHTSHGLQMERHPKRCHKLVLLGFVVYFMVHRHCFITETTTTTENLVVNSSYWLKNPFLYRTFSFINVSRAFISIRYYYRTHRIHSWTIATYRFSILNLGDKSPARTVRPVHEKLLYTKLYQTMMKNYSLLHNLMN